MATVVTSAPLSTGVGTKSTMSSVTTPAALATTLSSDADLFAARGVGKEAIAMLAAFIGVVAFLYKTLVDRHGIGNHHCNSFSLIFFY